MKKILFLAILALTFVGCSSDDDTTEEKDKYLSEIMIREYEYKFGVANTYGEVYENFFFDNKGNLLKKKTNYYNSIIGGRMSREYTYTYDDYNRLLEKNDYRLSLLDYKYLYTYNSIDSISKMIVYDGDGDLIETWTYEYDNTKRLTKATKIVNYISNNFGYIHNYTYSGNTITDTTYMLDDGSLFGITLDEYDSHGNLTSNAWTSGDTGRKVVQKGVLCVYNPNGSISKTTSWVMLPNDLTYKEYVYNDDGTIQKIHVSYSYKNNESDLIYEYIYK